MARISYNDVSDVMNSNNTNGVEFFSLKNNGDEAIVRIMHDSTDSFDIVSTHNVTMEGYKYGRKVSCIRDVHDPVDACPFCQAGMPIQTRFFIHLIEYTRDEQGKITGQPKIWERSTQYAKEIANLIIDYGPLSNCIFKIRRNGAAGDMKTTYSINYAPPTVYNPEFYPIDTSAFDGYSVMGTIVLGKSADDMREFLTTGSFPQKQSEKPATAYEPPVAPAPAAPTAPPMMNTQFTPYSPTAPTAPRDRNDMTETPPWANTTNGNSNNRYY